MRFRDQRLPIDTSINLLLEHEPRRAMLTNVSASGARLDGAGELAPGTLMTLCQLHHRLVARVVWSDGSRVGVRFVRALSPIEVQVLRGTTGNRQSDWVTVSHTSFRELS